MLLAILILSLGILMNAAAWFYIVLGIWGVLRIGEIAIAMYKAIRKDDK